MKDISDDPPGGRNEDCVLFVRSRTTADTVEVSVLQAKPIESSVISREEAFKERVLELEATADNKKFAKLVNSFAG